MTTFTDFLKEYSEKLKAEYESHIRMKLRGFVVKTRNHGDKIDREQYESLFKTFNGLNSWERELLLPLMSNELFLSELEYCLKNCSPNHQSESHPAATYDEAIVYRYVPELVRRLKEAETEIDRLRNEE